MATFFFSAWCSGDNEIPQLGLFGQTNEELERISAHQEFCVCVEGAVLLPPLRERPIATTSPSQNSPGELRK